MCSAWSELGTAQPQLVHVISVFIIHNIDNMDQCEEEVLTDNPKLLCFNWIDILYILEMVN